MSDCLALQRYAPAARGASTKVNAFNVNLTSADRERLRTFYRDVVGLEPHPMVTPAGFMAGGVAFVIDGHDQTEGQAKDPTRLMFNFAVDDIAAEQTRLEALGVRFLRPSTQEPWGGFMPLSPTRTEATPSSSNSRAAEWLRCPRAATV